MISNTHDYPFPNGIAVFWMFSLPPCVLLILLIWKVLQIIWESGLITGQLSTLLGVAIMCLMGVLGATIVVNSFPAIRMHADGLEIRFYFPFLTRWISLSWNDVEAVEMCASPVDVILRRREHGILTVYSSRLPLLFLIPSMIVRHSLRRGFFITNRIKGYEILVQSLTTGSLKSY